MIAFPRALAALGCSALLALAVPVLRADSGFFESFEIGLPGGSGAAANGIPSLTLASGEWYAYNHSGAIGSITGVLEGTTGGTFPAYDGSHYAQFNYNSTSGTNTISVWLITPQLSFTAGDTVSFFSRTVDNPNYPDRLVVRASDNGASTDIGTGPNAVGDFDMVLGTINPSLTNSGYPSVYTQFTYTVPFTGSGRIAFNYHVSNGGPTGTNSDNIAIDAVSINLASAIPEPSTFAALAGLGVLGLAAWRRRR